MNWKDEINSYYEKKKDRPFSKYEIDFFLEKTVLPALVEIESCLSANVKHVRIQRYTTKAKLRFDDRYINKSVFHIEVSAKWKSLCFPIELNDFYSSGEKINIDDLGAISKEFIFGKFMEFFRSREEKILEIKRRDFNGVDG